MVDVSEGVTGGAGVSVLVTPCVGVFTVNSVGVLASLVGKQPAANITRNNQTEHLQILDFRFIMLRLSCRIRYCSGACEKVPNLRCVRVLRTRTHLKFGLFLLMTE